MRPPWWYVVAAATVVWLVGVLTLGWIPESTTFADRVTGPIAIAMVVTWLAMPIALVLDQRAHGDDLAWSPSTPLWAVLSLVWFVNVVVGAAYCLRRYSAARHAPPSSNWASVVAGTVVAWIALFALDQALPPDALSSAAIDGLAALTVLAWMTMPVAVYLDAARIRGFTDWTPNTRVFVLLTVIPVVNVLAGAAYLYRRHEAAEGVDETTAFEPAGVTGPETADAPTVSPWYHRAGAVFVVYFLVLILLVVAAPGLSESGIQVLGLLLWLPFGPVFAVCVYRDAAWRREHDRQVGDRWSWYLLAAVVQAAAFWYLLRRASTASRHWTAAD